MLWSYTGRRHCAPRTINTNWSYGTNSAYYVSHIYWDEFACFFHHKVCDLLSFHLNAVCQSFLPHRRQSLKLKDFDGAYFRNWQKVILSRMRTKEGWSPSRYKSDEYAVASNWSLGGRRAALIFIFSKCLWNQAAMLVHRMWGNHDLT